MAIFISSSLQLWRRQQHCPNGRESEDRHRPHDGDQPHASLFKFRRHRRKNSTVANNKVFARN